MEGRNTESVDGFEKCGQLPSTEGACLRNVNNSRH